MVYYLKIHQNGQAHQWKWKVEEVYATAGADCSGFLLHDTAVDERLRTQRMVKDTTGYQGYNG